MVLRNVGCPYSVLDALVNVIVIIGTENETIGSGTEVMVLFVLIELVDF